MINNFFKELRSGKASGVAYKNLNFKRKLLSYCTSYDKATIAELSKVLNLSIPKITKIINELIEDGIVKDFGKVDSAGGRKPNVYGLAPESGFFLGVDVKQYHINIGLSDFQNNTIKIIEDYPYTLKNNENSLNELCEIVNSFIKKSPVSKDKILGLGLNLSGRINYTTGYSYSFFYFQEDPLSDRIESQIGIPVFLENDSRAMAYGEFSEGVVKDERNVLFLNLDYGLGMGIMIDKKLYYGKSGYSGEFGHFPIFENEIICKCGKKGCLETEASGWALIKMVQQSISEGSSTIITKNNILPEEIKLKDIIEAVSNDDMLSIELINKIGEKLGRAIALLINTFNPDLVVLGGCIAATGDYIRLPILSSIKKYSLNRVSNDTQLRMSKLGNRAGVIGACLLVRNKLLTEA